MLLNGDVVLKIEPRSLNLLTEKRNAVNLSYSIDVENRIFCKASCSYTFFDLSKNKTIDRGFFSSKGDMSYVLNYSVDPPKKGSGQLAYEFSSECSNKKSFLCRSDEQNRKSSSFTTLSYELSLAEKNDISIIKSELQKNIFNMSQIDIEMKNQSYVYDNLKSRMNLSVFNNKFQNLNNSYNILMANLYNAKKLWDAEEYSNLSILNNALSTNISILKNETSNSNLILKQNISLFFKTFNILKNFENILNLYNDLIKINHLYDFKTYAYLRDYYHLVDDFNSNDSSSYYDISTNTSVLSNKLIDDYKSKSMYLNGSINLWKNQFENEFNISINLNNTLFISLEKLCNLSNSIVNKSINLSTLHLQFCNSDFPNSDYSLYNFSLINLPFCESKNFTTSVSLSLKDHLPICCIFDECEVCCVDGVCYDKESNYPIILLHGHALSKDSSIENALSAFSQIQKSFILNGFIDAGIILPSSNFVESEKGILGKYGKPVIVKTTYYVNSNPLVYSAIFYESNNETIETYAKRLDETINLVKFKTGASKVNVIAHSMGGLVARKYLADFGEESVNKLIMVGTPNNGIGGLVESFCPLTGSFNECNQMKSSSAFINSLNNVYNNPKTTKTYVIYGTGCSLNGQDSDGIVFPNSAKLSYSLNFEIKGDCKEAMVLHQELLNVDKYPEVFQIIQNILKN